MSRVHYKAEFIRHEGNEVFYRYCPDTIYEKETRGEFKISLNEWQPFITLRAVPTGELIVYTDEHCVSSLTFSIRRLFEKNSEFPKEALFIA